MKLKLCLNCLYPKHFASDCKSDCTCIQCSRKHNNYIHDYYSQSSSRPQDGAAERNTNRSSVENSVSRSNDSNATFQMQSQLENTVVGMLHLTLSLLICDKKTRMSFTLHSAFES